jgi:hypothetical protein
VHLRHLSELVERVQALEKMQSEPESSNPAPKRSEP